MSQRRPKSSRTSKISKSKRKESDEDVNEKALEKRTRALQREAKKLKRKRKEVSNLGKSLKNAIIEMEKSANYYRRQVETFKDKQNEWIVEQQPKNLKFVWCDDIKKVRLRRERKGGGMKIWFRDGHSAVFRDIDVWRNVFDDDTKKDPYDHDPLILDIIKEIKLQIQKEGILNDKDSNNDNDNAADDEVDEEEEEDESSENSEDDLLEQLIETLLNEMNDRMKDFEHISAINPDNYRNELEKYVQNVEERHNEMMKYHELEHNNHLYRESLLAQTPMMPVNIANIACDELRHRIEDLKTVKNIILTGEGDANKNKKLREYVSQIKAKRHENIFKTSGNDNNSAERYQSFQSDIKENNKKWRHEIAHSVHSKAEEKLFKAQQQIDELKSELAEKNIVLDHFEAQIIESDTKYKELKSEHESHSNAEITKVKALNNKISKKLIEYDTKYKELQSEYKRSKKEHKQVTKSMTADFESELSRLKLVNSSLSNAMVNFINHKNEKMVKEEPESKIDESWLCLDMKINTFINSIPISSEQEKLLCFIGGWLNRIIPTSDDLQPISLQKLYVPMDDSDANIIIHTLFDGVLFATLINLLESDFLDLRALHMPNHNDKVPKILSIEQIKENMSIILSCVRALDICQFSSNTQPISDYFDSKYTLNIILYIVMSLFDAMNNKRINIKTHPELIRFCNDDKEKRDAQNIEWKDWLDRWLKFCAQTKKRRKESSIDLNFSEQESLSDPSANAEEFEQECADFEDEMNTNQEEENKYFEPFDSLSKDYHNDILIVCAKLDSSFNIEAVNKEINGNKDNFKGYQMIIKCIKNKIGIRNTFNITINDLRNHNFLLQQVLLSEIFMTNNLVQKVSQSENKTIIKTITNKSKSDKAMIAWINSFGWNHKLRINNLDRDLSDGVIILKLLSECRANCVKWKNVRKRSKIRHVYDKLANCKMIMDVIDAHFNFSLVGMDGADIVDCHPKFLKTLLWQINLYHSTKSIDIQWNDEHKMITDKDMVSWSNEQIKKYQQMDHVDSDNLLIKNEIGSLSDKSLADSIYFLNLIASINSKWVNYSLVHKITSSKNNDQFKKKRKANARYLVTLIRRLGQNIFISVDDICRVESRAVISVIASIMTIHSVYNKEEN